MYLFILFENLAYNITHFFFNKFNYGLFIYIQFINIAFKNGNLKVSYFPREQTLEQIYAMF